MEPEEKNSGGQFSRCREGDRGREGGREKQGGTGSRKKGRGVIGVTVHVCVYPSTWTQ